MRAVVAKLRTPRFWRRRLNLRRKDLVSSQTNSEHLTLGDDHSENLNIDSSSLVENILLPLFLRAAQEVRVIGVAPDRALLNNWQYVLGAGTYQAANNSFLFHDENSHNPPKSSLQPQMR